MNTKGITREYIEDLNDVEPHCFETDREEQWFNVGLKYGLDVADANPKSPWISVEDDLPCNHEEMVVSSGIEEKDTLIVLVRFAVGFVDFAYMYYSNNEWKWNTYFKVSHWMLVPEFRED